MLRWLTVLVLLLPTATACAGAPLNWASMSIDLQGPICEADHCPIRMPEETNPLTFLAILRWQWVIDPPCAIESTQPPEDVLIRFDPKDLLNPPWLAVAAEPDHIVITTSDQLDPANQVIDTEGARTRIAYPFEITWTLTRPPTDTELAEFVENRTFGSGYLIARSLENGKFRESFAVEVFDFAAPTAFEAQSPESQQAPGPGLGLLGVLAAVALLQRRR